MRRSPSRRAGALREACELMECHRGVEPYRSNTGDAGGKGKKGCGGGSEEHAAHYGVEVWARQLEGGIHDGRVEVRGAPQRSHPTVAGEAEVQRAAASHPGVLLPV
eukprot:CAMPEP_0177779776 /NCGR_PEP_ID=MMETSP0491_2-20121128/16806_1 /TAXON_ID=63592 /ORGANISM="Tetraselmis chuii, Strain PLY429" /LENGTH=105 /DNA_ID=CAMNT_0019299415 /DNA_START=221 /DNA_END=535 /DNA_ORIENTATION=+